MGGKLDNLDTAVAVADREFVAFLAKQIKDFFLINLQHRRLQIPVGFVGHTLQNVVDKERHDAWTRSASLDGVSLTGVCHSVSKQNTAFALKETLEQRRRHAVVDIELLRLGTKHPRKRLRELKGKRDEPGC